MSFDFGINSLKNLEGVHPLLIQVLKFSLIESPYDFGIVQGVRNQKYQDDLYAQGRTKPGKIVTWTRNSKHLIQKDGYGHAIDFAVFIDGKITWDEKYYKLVADCILKIAKKEGINIESGAYWSKPDYGHIEINI